MQTIHDWMVAYGMPPTVEELRGALGVQSNRTVLRYLSRLEEEGDIERWPGARGIRLLRAPGQGVQTRAIPLVGHAPPGLLLYAEENRQAYVRIPEAFAVPSSANFFLLRVRNDSMNRAWVEGGSIQKGDLVLVRQQPKAESGSIVVAVIDGEAIIRRFTRGLGHVVLKPESSNTAHQQVLASRDVPVQGVVTRVIKSVRSLLAQSAPDLRTSQVKDTVASLSPPHLAPPSGILEKGGPMASPTLVDATDLESWAKRRAAQDMLPQLLRRLVLATAKGVRRAGFRSGEGVALEGWDGIVVAEEGNAFVPQGLSVWEIGAGRDIKGKADSDYRTRSDNPEGIAPEDATFVFVTPRRWPKKDDWARKKQQEGTWSAVRALDADDLEAWLQLAPGVHTWLSIVLGKHPEDATDLENYWLDWSEATKPPITPDLVLAGRADLREQLVKWIRGVSPLLALKGESRDEAIAVVASVLDDLQPEERLNFLSRTLMVDSIAAWRQLATCGEPLILIPIFDVRDVIVRATRAGHRVILPLGRADSSVEATLEIPRLSTQEAAKLLSASDAPDDRAWNLARLARKSLMTFRRRMAVSPEVQQPEWARPENARSLVPALLAGAWSDTNENDRHSVAALAAHSYEAGRQDLVRWANETDAPVRHVGESWFLVSAEDMWTLLAPYLLKDDLKRLEAVALDVLGEVDPRFDLPKDEQWLAASRGKVPRHSGLLRQGLADTLALLGSRDEASYPSGITPVPQYSAYIVRLLLERANADWRLWASLSPLLRSLAEAAPDSFLSAVEHGMMGETPTLQKLFADQDFSLFSSSPHTGLLWALEVLSWSPDYLSHAADALAGLVEIDPGGQLNNRPLESLRRIFLLWYPQTTATLDERLKVIDTLRERHPDAAWRLLRGLLPDSHQTTHDIAKPQFRDWQVERPRVTIAEYHRAAHEIFARMLVDAASVASRWEDLIKALDDLSSDDFEAAVKQLEVMNPEDLGATERAQFCDALRRMVSHHRSYPNAAWALPKANVDRLAQILSRFEPPDLISRCAWLFTSSVDLPEGREDDWRKQEELTLRLRIEAASTVHSALGLEGLLKLAEVSEFPYVLGIAVGQGDVLGQHGAHFLKTHLACNELKLAEFARGFVNGSVILRGPGWAREQLERNASELSPQQRALLLVCTPAEPVTWDLASRYGPETEAEYWRAVPPYHIRDISNLNQALGKLLDYGRPFSAVEALSLHRMKVTPTLIADTLERILGTPPRDDRPAGHLSYEVGQLLELLTSSSEVDESRIAGLEWNFLPLLGQRDYAPHQLHRELARNIDFFAEVVALVFRAEGEPKADVSDNEEGTESSEARKARAQRGYELLKSWRTVPGTQPDGNIDGIELAAWVRRARAAVAERSRPTVGDLMIGEMLSGCPHGSDGAWPHEAVRDVIETARSAEIESGLEVGRFNSRGVVTRSLFEGGAQERGLASTYSEWARMVKDRWPRTAAMLRRIAASYRDLARREDEAAELREDLGT